MHRDRRTFADVTSLLQLGVARPRNVWQATGSQSHYSNGCPGMHAGGVASLQDTWERTPASCCRRRCIATGHAPPSGFCYTVQPLEVCESKAASCCRQ